ncbi:amidase [Mycobacterium kansasii]|uniref:amidase n=1 Tax=Mycobacterium attenuatum TaxID=2341086 RepID=A0A498QCE0_9MYCO|nr:amidase family protein [Mycobacterium attenuatum]ORB84247.1 amidase [Mycobacterium kansasii]VBA43017.1 Putative amidase AmiC [Mycobacterium attenuatum]
MRLDEYLPLDATALAELVESKQVTPAELLALARQRADAVNPQLNAIVRRLDDVADEQAADPRLGGPFAGVPFLIKDLDQEYRGFPTSCGSRSLANDVAKRHALITQRFLDAGLVIFGKTNTPEFGAKGVTEPDYWGPARNPWNTQRTPGGSSGGSGAAVAAGVVPAAGANDGGGSIRIPAACNGLVGLKLSRGLSPYGPQTGEPLFGMAVQGVVSRTVRDSAGLYDAVIGPNPRAAYQVWLPDGPFAAHIKNRPGTLRIGYSTSSAINPHPDREAVAAVDDAARLLADLGHRVEEVKPPYDDAALARDFLIIWFAQLYRHVAEIKQRTGASDSDFEADTLGMCELARSAGVLPPMQALENINNYIQSLTTFHDDYDYFLTPTLATPPLAVGATATSPRLQLASRLMSKLRAGKVLALTGILDDLIQESLGWVPYTQLANLTGRPAISVPLHWTDDGLPLGVQFVGRLGADGDLLQLAAQLEEARPWAHRHPAPVVSG